MTEKTLTYIKFYLKKATQLSNLCLQYKNTEKETQFWKLSCQYVADAKKLYMDNEAIFRQFGITEEEVETMIRGFTKPLDVEGCDCNDGKTESESPSPHSHPSTIYPSTLPPPPTEWATIHTMSRQISALESEISSSRRLAADVAAMNQQYELLSNRHLDFMQRTEREQTILQNELKQFQETEHQVEMDRDYFEREVGVLRERLSEVYRKNREEMNRMIVELDNAHHDSQLSMEKLHSVTHELDCERERFQTERERFQTEQERFQTERERFQSEHEHFQSQIEQYRNVFTQLLPHFDENQCAIIRGFFE